MQLLEPVAAALGGLDDEIKKECPFKEEPEGVTGLDPEDRRNDDLDTQENDGGKLGRNVIRGSPGADNTWSGSPPKYIGLRIDTRRTGVRVKVPGVSGVPDGVYGFTVAAHHLIPGDASLAPSKLKPFMTENESVEIQLVTNTGTVTKQKKISMHIGYNVNGSHNGVWLPGNYYIRETTSPIANKSWSDLGDHAWCMNYVAAVCRVADGQMHDTHTEYSGTVKDYLNKIAEKLMKHECTICAAAKINPPFKIKTRLYNLSLALRTQAEAPPSVWKRPWFISDRWREAAFAGGKPKQAFMDIYNSATAQLPS